jgi:hypothetical protein
VHALLVVPRDHGQHPRLTGRNAGSSTAGNSSPAWGEREKRRLYDELMGIDDSATRMLDIRGDFRD